MDNYIAHYDDGEVFFRTFCTNNLSLAVSKAKDAKHDHETLLDVCGLGRRDFKTEGNMIFALELRNG